MKYYSPCSLNKKDPTMQILCPSSLGGKNPADPYILNKRENGTLLLLVKIGRKSVFVAFVEDNATISSIEYFENHVSYFVQN